jgi:hypothetical protein
VCIAAAPLSFAYAQAVPAAKAPPPMLRVVPPPTDPFAAMVKAGGNVELEGETYRLEFLVDGPLAALRIRGGPNGGASVYPLTSPDEILLLLADRKVEFLWPAITQWAGPSLERLKSNLLASAKGGYDRQRPVFFANESGQSILRPPARAVSQYARILQRTGDHSGAVALLRREALALNLKKGWGRTEYSILWTQLVGVLHNSNQSDAALAELSTGLAALGSSQYADNLAITRAAVLTESGRYAEGLRAVNKVWDQYRKRGDAKVAGSERQFAWIRACALHGLGRIAEAKAAFPDLEARPDPVDKDWVVPTNASIQSRAMQCTGDVEGLVRLTVAELESGRLLPAILLVLQPDYEVQEGVRSVWAKVRADPRVIAAAKGRIRLLPHEYAPALRGWRPATAALTPAQ